MQQQLLVQWRFLSYTTFGVHVLHIYNFQFSSIEKFQSGGLREEKVNYLGFLVGFIYNNHSHSLSPTGRISSEIYNNHVWFCMLNYMVRLNVKVP